MPESPDLKTDSLMKWPAILAVLVIMVMIGSYDLMIAGFVGAAIAAVAVIALWIRIRLATAPGEPESERAVMGDRFLRSAHNRQRARVRETASSRNRPRGRSDEL
ncbi:hypothetical protein [Erythrobacter ani]|uniref:Uncharacterized protein n=1 Tax=Erythrobacter ani TaxID=2827235 RepID=A0ABS6SJE3_9SPHN|nr:hypothetical protein [Erythrobacter ani]MBV7265077.1 hypothetical protein [Erythrobacter ani]